MHILQLMSVVIQLSPECPGPWQDLKFHLGCEWPPSMCIFHFLIILTNGHLVQYFYVLFARCSLNVPALGRGRVKACYLLCLLTKHPSPSELYSISMGPRLSRQRGGEGWSLSVFSHQTLFWALACSSSQAPKLLAVPKLRLAFFLSVLHLSTCQLEHRPDTRRGGGLRHVCK